MWKTLKKCQTFNDLGLDVLKTLGRAGLWGDEDGFSKFIAQNQYKGVFTDPIFSARYQVQSDSFTYRPCKWYFVELLEGEFEDSDPDAMADAPGSEPQHPPRKASGEPCPHAGWWFSPAREGSRQYFRDGAIFPKLEGDYGYTFWLWSPDQSRPTL